MALNTLGKYELLEEIGHGGFGTVYRARETSLDIIRAVKILHPTLITASEFIDRFRREGKTTAQLDHPHIVPIYELGEEQGYYYLTMKYLPGGSLKDWLERRGHLPYGQAVEILQQVAQALEYALEQPEHLIHCDIKPGNILFERQPDDPKGVSVRLSDFGFAKALVGGDSSSFSASGGIKGTPAYIAPEIWDDQPASPASDQYALACVLYEMLTGHVLFSGSTPMALMKNVAAGPKFPETWPPGVPGEVSHVLHRALAAEPRERYARVTDFTVACAGLAPATQETNQKRQTEGEVILANAEYQGKTQSAVDDKAVHLQNLTEIEASEKNEHKKEAKGTKKQNSPGEVKSKYQKLLGTLPGWAWSTIALAVVILMGLGITLRVGLFPLTSEAPTKPVMISTIAETATPTLTKKSTSTPTISATLTPTSTPTIRPTITRTSTPTATVTTTPTVDVTVCSYSRENWNDPSRSYYHWECYCQGEICSCIRSVVDRITGKVEVFARRASASYDYVKEQVNQYGGVCE